MTSASIADNGTLADVEFILAAFIRQAHADAERVAGFIERWLTPLNLGGPISFPAEILLELAAIIRIAAWQRAGFDSDLADAFPPAKELLEGLISRFISDPGRCRLEVAACRGGLWSRVISTWFTRCAWNASADLGADIALDQIDEELLLNQLADFLQKIQDCLNKD